MNQRGIADWILIVGVFVVLALVGLVVIATTDQSAPPPTSQEPGVSSVCYTYSLGFLEFQCGDNKFMGGSLGIWDCKAGIGAHTCR